MLKKYSELGHVYRNEPCEEYPGEYLVYSSGKLVGSYADLNSARMVYKKESHPDNQTKLCWNASENDPRIGQVWFTYFYRIL